MKVDKKNVMIIIRRISLKFFLMLLSSASKITVEFPGTNGGRLLDPYAVFGGQISVRFEPTFIPTTQ